MLNRPSRGHNRLRVKSKKRLILVVEAPRRNHFVGFNTYPRLTALMLLCSMPKLSRISVVLSIVYSYHRSHLLHSNRTAEKALSGWKEGLFDDARAAYRVPEVTESPQCTPLPPGGAGAGGKGGVRAGGGWGSDA